MYDLIIEFRDGESVSKYVDAISLTLNELIIFAKMEYDSTILRVDRAFKLSDISRLEISYNEAQP